MLSIGLTGGIGAGKSTVARRLAAAGALVIDADQLARAVVARGMPALSEITATFGAAVLTPDGDLDRPALGRLVFADAEARARLNEITHPRITALTAQTLAQAPPDAVVVHDVPLLVENRMQDRYHLVVVVHASVQQRVARLVQQRRMTLDDAVARVAAQADDDVRRAAADVWLDNSGAPESLGAEVDALWAERLVPFEENLRARRCGGSAPPADHDDAWADRVRSRVARATGLTAGGLLRSAHGLGSADELAVVVRDQGHAVSMRPALEDAGFPWLRTVPPHAVLHCSADPAVRLLLRLTWENLPAE